MSGDQNDYCLTEEDERRIDEELLTSAAPDLLAALEAIVSECQLPPQLQDLVDAAIAKARGRP